MPEALRRQPLEGVDQPIQIYLTCYHILREVGDPRAADVLARAHDQMTANTARIFDPVIRAAFLKQVPDHRELAGLCEQRPG